MMGQCRAEWRRGRSREHPDWVAAVRGERERERTERRDTGRNQVTVEGG